MNGKKKAIKFIKKQWKIKTSSNKIEELINRVDPDKVKCSYCGKWIDRKDSIINKNTEKCYCSKCGPKHMFEKLAMPLMRSYFPKLITKDLISVTPMDAPKGLVFNLKTSYNKHGN